MRFYPTKIHLAFLCFTFISISLNLGCSKDSDLLADTVISDSESSVIIEEEEESSPTTTQEEQAEEVTGNSNPEDSLVLRTTSFSPLHDAHVQSGRGYNQNIIRLEEDNRTSYLMFDLSQIADISGTLKEATLQFTVDSDDGSGTVNVYRGASSEWTENTLSDESAPEAIVQIGSIAKAFNIGETQAIELDVADMLAEVKTLILQHKDGNDFAFASKEHVSKIGPKLVVTYEVSESAEEIDEPEITEETIENQNTNEENAENQNPMAVADASPSSGGVPLQVTFQGSNSSDDVEITNYAWDFKDGTTSSEANPTHTFTKVGTYEVELIVNDKQGLSSTDKVTITVNENENQAPKAVVSATPVSGEAPLEVSFKGSDSSDDNSIAQYGWDFKDGSKTNVADFTYTYDDPGTYEAELTVTDENGLTDIATITITVTEPQNSAPSAVILADPTTGTAPLEVQFVGDNSFDDTGITSYFWDFKDGTTSNSSNPTHTFNQAGNYIVGLAVTDAKGLSSSTSVTITVNEPVNNTPTVNAPPGYYVATNGNSSNNGQSPSNPWSIEHAFNVAKAGDIIYVKAGNYGNKQVRTNNNGTSGAHIKFIGYKDTPGDIVSNNGSTFNFGESVDARKMPLLQGSNGTGTAITVHDRHVDLENFQITGYNIGVQTISIATNNTLKNIIVTRVGNQSNASSYTGVGFKVEGNNAVLENCFVLNAGAESFTLSDSDYSIVRNCKVYATNASNPTDYYFLLTGGTNNSIVENSYAERASNLPHGGHGFDMKDIATNNIFRNCTAKRTNFELNFSGVRYNTITDCKIYGINTSSSNWHAVLAIFNGANNNLIKNMYIQDTWAAISWGDYDDGFVGPGGDRDEVSLGYDNTFDGIVVKNTNRFLNIGGGNQFSAAAKRNKLINCDVSNFEFAAVTYYRTESIIIQNSKFTNGRNGVIETQGQYAPYSKFNVSWINNTWSNVSFTPPN